MTSRGGTYQQRFRATSKMEGEIPWELSAQLMDPAKNWTRGCDSVEELQKKLLPLEEKCNWRERVFGSENKCGNISDLLAYIGEILQWKQITGHGNGLSVLRIVPALLDMALLYGT